MERRQLKNPDLVVFLQIDKTLIPCRHFTGLIFIYNKSCRVQELKKVLTRAVGLSKFEYETFGLFGGGGSIFLDVWLVVFFLLPAFLETSSLVFF